MKEFIPDSVKKLADMLPKPLYIVGGFVRNFLIDCTVSSDIDIAAALSTEEIISAAESLGYKIVAVYKRTGTAVIFDGKQKYEYTRFRTDVYGENGMHTPIRTEFTENIKADALRRDFTCNAVYYDVKNDKIVDPLGGATDIRNKIIKTVKNPEEVFSSDGLRLMRLARFCGELNFKPTEEVLGGAREYAKNIRDIASERIYDELKKILVADGKYDFSDKIGHYTALKVLESTGVFDILFPELALGRGLAQKAEFHSYDVLEHSLHAVCYAEKALRLAALLHDVGKPFCKITYGTFHGHAEHGAVISANMLRRFKADKRTIADVMFLVRWHMFDVKLEETEQSIRQFIVENRSNLSALLKLKQADYSAGHDDVSVCPTVAKWLDIYKKMKEDGTPLSVKDLKISSKTLMDVGFSRERIGAELKTLFNYAVINPVANNAEFLREKAERDFKLLR